MCVCFEGGGFVLVCWYAVVLVCLTFFFFGPRLPLRRRTTLGGRPPLLPMHAAPHHPPRPRQLKRVTGMTPEAMLRRAVVKCVRRHSLVLFSLRALLTD